MFDIIMKSIFLVSFIIAATLVKAQEPLRLPAAEQELERTEGIYARAKNLYDAGISAKNYEERIELFDKSAEIFDTYLRNAPQGNDAKAAQYYLGMCFYHEGKVDDAKRVFNSIMGNQGKGPFVAAAASVLAHEAFEKKDYSTAAALYGRLAQNATRAKDRQRGNYFQALCYHYRGNEDSALKGYMSVIQDSESETGSFLNNAKLGAGGILLKQSKFNDALIMFEAVINSGTLDKAKAEATLFAGVTALQLKNSEKAESYFKDILSNNNDNWKSFHDSALTSLMKIRFDKKMYDQVIEIFRSNPLNTGDKNQADRSMMAANSSMLLGQFANAIPLFTQVQKIIPDTEDAFEASYRRLQCFFKVNGQNIVEQVDGFIEIYGKKYKVNPKIHEALMMKASSLAQKGKSKEAAETFNLIDATLISENNRANLLYHRGYALADTSDNQGAIRSLTKFIESYSSDKRTPKAMMKRAISYVIMSPLKKI
jgi:TolA-binding protein